MKKNKALKALANGFLDGGVEIVTNFPGFKSHELFSMLGGATTSVNEKIAYEIAWGASYAGKRAVVTFKNVGLNVAADPFLNSMLVGVNAGLVVVIFDDIQVEGSQSRQDSRHYFDFFKGLWFEPYSAQSAYDIAYNSFALSEKFQIPVIIRITNQLADLLGEYSRKKTRKKTFPPAYDHKRFVVHPINSKRQRQILAKKNTKIQNYVNSLYRKRLEKVERENKFYLLVFGCCLSEEKIYLKKDSTKIQLFSYPIPKTICELIKGSNKIQVLEQGDSFAYEKILNLITNSPKVGGNTGFIPDKSRGYIISGNYEKLFSAIKGIRSSFIIGDLGEYTKDTLDTIDACLCLGSSIGVGIGCLMAGFKNVFSIIGDGAYLHSGNSSIAEAIERGFPIKIVVICNGGSQGTGGQKIPGDPFYQPKNVNVYKIDYEQSKIADFKKVLTRMKEVNAVSVLYVLM